MLLAAVCESPGNYWHDGDITKLLNFRHKALLVGYLSGKHPFWNSVVSNSWGAKTAEFTGYKWIRNFNNTTISHSLLSYGKWWLVRYCCAQECSVVLSHCLRYSGLKSPTNLSPLAESYESWKSFGTGLSIHRLRALSKPGLWINCTQ
jgi:hypothetical protein